MVVGEAAHVAEQEIIGVAKLGGHVPYFIEWATGLLARQLLTAEPGVFGSYHVQQHAVLGLVARGQQVLGPVLRAQAPRVATAVELVLQLCLSARVVAPVLGINEDEIDAHIGGQAVGQLAEDAGHFQGHGHAAGPIGRTVHGRILLGLVVVGEGAGIPVREDGHPAHGRGLVLRNDVAGPDVGPVKGHGLEGLLQHLKAIALELGHQPVAGSHVGLGVGHARPKRHLLGRKGIRRIAAKDRGLGQLGRGGGAGIGGFGGLLVRAAGEEQQAGERGKGKAEGCEFHAESSAARMGEPHLRPLSGREGSLAIVIIQLKIRRGYSSL